jgi:hypothetical protein
MNPIPVFRFHDARCIPCVLLLLLPAPLVRAQAVHPVPAGDTISVRGFEDSAHHSRYAPREVMQIAENILRYRKQNGGWPKNHDMQAVLTPDQLRALAAAGSDTNTTFDNGATHTHVHYLAEAWRVTREERYRDACLRGIDFILAAQLPHGVWPQFFPDKRGYRRYITFNDGAMIGVMSVLQRIVERNPAYLFVDSLPRARHRLFCVVWSAFCALRSRLAASSPHGVSSMTILISVRFRPDHSNRRRSAGVKAPVLSCFS